MAPHISNYIGRNSAFHQLGTVKGDFLTRADVDAAGVTFEAEKHQLEFRGNQIEAWGVFHPNGQFIAPCGENYEIHQPGKLFDIGDAIIEAQGGTAKYETAGNLLGFRKVWGLIDLAASLRVGDDQLIPFLLLVSSFDGSVATLMMQTIVRVVCSNTLQLALSNKSQNALRIRHTSRSQQKLVDAKAAMLSVNQDIRNTEEALNFLAGRMVNASIVTDILEKVLETGVVKSEALERVRENKRRANILDEIIGLYELNDNNAFPEQRGTAYNLLNAVTHYTDHLRSTRTTDGQDSDTNRAIAATIGSGQTLKAKAYGIIMETAKSLPMRPERGTMVQVLELPPTNTPVLDSILAEM